MINPTHNAATNLLLFGETSVSDLLEDWDFGGVPSFETWNELVTEFVEEVFTEGC